LHLQSRHSTTLATSLVHFAMLILETVSTQTICLGWPQTLILPISASQVARITGMSYQHLATVHYLMDGDRAPTMCPTLSEALRGW
jgi:hypothetical protein